MKEGFRRLSLFGGVLGVVIWILFVLDQTAPIKNVRVAIVLLFGVVGSIVAFFAIWAFVRGVGWVVEGFLQGRNGQN